MEPKYITPDDGEHVHLVSDEIAPLVLARPGHRLATEDEVEAYLIAHHLAEMDAKLVGDASETAAA